MQEFELRITPKDWLGIIILGITFSTTLSVLLYLLLGYSVLHGFMCGVLLGIHLGIISFTFIYLNNNYIIPRISSENKLWWWILAAFASIVAGMIGFYLAYLSCKIFKILIPEPVIKNLPIIIGGVGILNYLVGLLLFFFIRMRNRKELLLRKTLHLKMLAHMRMVESHFISNLLNNLIELMHKDINKAETALINLAKYLRNILDERDLVPLSQELDLVNSYVYFQNIRFTNLINLINEITERKTLNLTLPKFTLQFLVENAIKHGFMGKKLNIKIRTFINNSNIILEVENDGRPIKHYKLGDGLKILTERLALYLDGKLELVSKDPVKFHIVIPKKSKNIIIKDIDSFKETSYV